MLLFKPKDKPLYIKSIKNNKLFLNSETFTLNYVFFFPQYSLTITYPKTTNFLFDIKDTFYLKFPKFILRYYNRNFSNKLNLVAFDVVGDKIFVFKRDVIVKIPDFIPNFYKDFLNVIYNSGAITNFYSDLFFVSTLMTKF